MAVTTNVSCAPAQPFAVGVTTIVVVWIVARLAGTVKVTVAPVPLPCDNPTAVFELVHAKVGLPVPLKLRVTC